MAKVEIRLANAVDETDTLTLKIEGSNDWVRETMTCVHGLFESISENSPFDVANADDAVAELRDAYAMAEDGNSYAGRIVTTHITVLDETADAKTA